MLAELLWRKLSLLPTDPGEFSAFDFDKSLCDQLCNLNCETNNMLLTCALMPNVQPGLQTPGNMLVMVFHFYVLTWLQILFVFQAMAIRCIYLILAGEVLGSAVAHLMCSPCCCMLTLTIPQFIAIWRCAGYGYMCACLILAGKDFESAVAHFMPLHFTMSLHFDTHDPFVHCCTALCRVWLPVAICAPV